MNMQAGFYAAQLRQELTLRSRIYARGRAHVESYGSAPVIVYEPENGRHSNFFDAAYSAIAANPDWMRRFDKVHAQAARSLPSTSRWMRWPMRQWRSVSHIFTATVVWRRASAISARMSANSSPGGKYVGSGECFHTWHSKK